MEAKANGSDSFRGGDDRRLSHRALGYQLSLCYRRRTDRENHSIPVFHQRKRRRKSKQIWHILAKTWPTNPRRPNQHLENGCQSKQKMDQSWETRAQENQLQEIVQSSLHVLCLNLFWDSHLESNSVISPYFIGFKNFSINFITICKNFCKTLLYIICKYKLFLSFTHKNQ